MTPGFPCFVSRGVSRFPPKGRETQKRFAGLRETFRNASNVAAKILLYMHILPGNAEKRPASPEKQEKRAFRGLFPARQAWRNLCCRTQIEAANKCCTLSGSPWPHHRLTALQPGCREAGPAPHLKMGQYCCLSSRAAASSVRPGVPVGEFDLSNVCQSAKFSLPIQRI